MRGLLSFVALLVLFAVVPAAASATEVKTFHDGTELFPAGNAQSTVGPANRYPATIAVAGLTGKVLQVSATVSIAQSAKPEDIDLALVGPNGGEVMLLSDACGHAQGLIADEWTFTDAAPTFVSFVACNSNQSHAFLPTNYRNETGPEEDDLSVDGGPTGPFVNTMATLAGGSPDGEWKLYALDDQAEAVGFVIRGWTLALEIEPAPPLVAPVITAPAAPAPAATPAAAKRTGKRARALARCFKKSTPKARRICRRHARKLPL